MQWRTGISGHGGGEGGGGEQKHFFQRVMTIKRGQRSLAIKRTQKSRPQQKILERQSHQQTGGSRGHVFVVTVKKMSPCRKLRAPGHNWIQSENRTPLAPMK